MDFITAAIKAGFTESQARFMEAFLAKHPHQHEIDDIEGLSEELEGLEELEAGELDDEEEEDDEQ